MKTAKIIFWIGILVAVVGVLGQGYDFIQSLALSGGQWNNTTGIFPVAIFSSIGQGALLVAAAKIIELLAEKSHR